VRVSGWKARFFTIWTGQAFSLVGSSLVRFAVIWWLTEETGSATVLAMASLAAFTPAVVLGPFLGALIDRWSRRWIMAIADGAVALLTALLALLYWLGIIEVWHVYVLLFLRALGETFHEPAMTASTTLMVPEEQLTRVAGMNQARQSLTFLAGPVLGALLVEWLSIPGVLAIDVLTALPAIGPLLFLAVPQPVSEEDDAATGGWRALIREMGQGFRYLWGWRGIFVLLMTTSLIVFFQRPAVSFMPLLVTQHFGGGPREMGWISAAFNVGSVSGGILLSAWGGFRHKIVSMVVSLVAYGLLSLARGLTPSDGFWFLVGATLLGGLASPMFFASLRAMLQSTVPPEMQGRVFATQNSLVLATGPLGLAILGPLADRIGVQTLFVLSGMACLLVALVWLLTPSVRRAEEGPPERWPGVRW
jgi:DHA3 family macrolide efflux protein-like MFS transporter